VVVVVVVQAQTLVETVDQVLLLFLTLHRRNVAQAARLQIMVLAHH
jgi:hypothetical protein